MEIKNYYKALRVSLCGRGITSTIANFTFLAFIVSIPWAIFGSLTWICVAAPFALLSFFAMASKEFDKQAKACAMTIAKQISQMTDSERMTHVYHGKFSVASKPEQVMINDMTDLLLNNRRGQSIWDNIREN